MMALLGGFELLLVLPFLVLGLLGTVFWIWMLIDCAMNEPSEGNDKLVWILVILFTHLLGALIYFFVRRPNRLPLRP
jgi:hypothetical protein